MKALRAVPVVALLATLFLPARATACSCAWGGPFAKVALGQDLVVHGEVLGHYKNSMEVRVLEVLRGKEERSKIRIWGDNGALCRPYVNSFRAGTRWLFAVSSLRDTAQGHQPASFWERLFPRTGGREYEISVCGAFWLEVRGQKAIGRIATEHHSRAREWVPLQHIIAWIQSNGRAITLSPTPMSAVDP